VTPESEHADAPLACLACGAGGLTTVETIPGTALVDAWRAEDRATGADGQDDARASALRSALPDTIRFERCWACGLEMAWPAVVWSSSAFPRDQSYPVRWEFFRCVEELGPDPLDVLELGCGTGEFLSLAAACGHRAIGIDFSDAAVAVARERGLSAVCGGFEDLRHHVGADVRFDAVMMFHVLEHVATPDSIFAEIARWIRPDGRLFLSCPGPRRFTRLITEQQLGRSDYWDYPPQHVLRWTLPALRAIVGRHGWRVLSAVEEPLSRVAAGSQIGVVRAMYRRHPDSPVRRRLSIALGRLRVLAAPATRRAGVAIYLSASREFEGSA
jgi:SAM-dependent methyltransferase